MKKIWRKARRRPVFSAFTLLILISLLLPFNFVILAPGPTVNLLHNAVSIKGISSNKSNGELYSTAVFASGPNQMPLGYQVLQAWADGDLVVMPRNALYNAGEKASAAKARQLQEMTDSQSNAALAAWNFISQIPGHEKPSWNEKDVKIILKNTGGGSAGLAFALAIIAKTADPNLIAGRKVAATGTIAQNGNVGEIGGVDQKILSASLRGAEIFLMPKASCASQSKNPNGMKIYAVATLSDAVHALALADTAAVPSIFACPRK
jgi:PDZ domain-containing protein